MADPANTSLPVITGTRVSGRTLACSQGEWTEDPTIFSFQWRRIPVVTPVPLVLGVPVAIAGETAATYRQTSADLDHYIDSVVTAENEAPAPTPATPWVGWTIPAVPGGATVITSAAALLAALASPADDAVYDATGLTHDFTDKVLITGRCSDGHPATFFLGSGVRFTKSSLVTDPAVDVKGAQNLVIYGGDVTNPQNGLGITLRGSSGVPAKNVIWWGFLIHDVAMSGLFVHQNSGNVQGCDFRGEIDRWCRVPALDPHNTKGSGLHGAYIGVTGSGSVNTSQFVLHVHDSQYGGGVQLGPHLTDVDVQVQAERLTYDPPSGADGTGGNAVQIFGDGQDNLTVSYVVADTVRKAVETSGLGTPTNQIQVTHGVVTNYRVSPPYTVNGHVAYTDCS